MLSNEEFDFRQAFLQHTSWNHEHTTIQHAKDVNEPLIIQPDVAMQDHIISLGELLYIDPMICLRDEQNPFAGKSRVYPVDFDLATGQTLLLNLIIPEGYAIDFLPANTSTQLPGQYGTVHL